MSNSSQSAGNRPLQDLGSEGVLILLILDFAAELSCAIGYEGIEGRRRSRSPHRSFSGTQSWPWGPGRRRPRNTTCLAQKAYP